jgi:di/tricarboxylate transporter
MGVLAVTEIVSPKEALAGFSNPAVVTIWAVFILSGGLTRTGIANILGRQLLKVAGGGGIVAGVIIMVIAGGLSAFMNNVAVAALMLPVVMDIARKTDRSPSILLMPLAYGSLLGGLTTMIGTPPNILVSEALRENGLEPFQAVSTSHVTCPNMLGRAKSRDSAVISCPSMSCRNGCFRSRSRPLPPWLARPCLTAGWDRP